MAQIAYLLLCHSDPDAIATQARALAAAGDTVTIHFDGNAPREAYATLQHALRGVEGVVFTPRRLRCGWGEWSLVAATIEAARTALAAFPEATHFYMISGNCGAIKSASYARAFLDRRQADFIESYDFLDSNWIKTGLHKERLIYRHYVNERRHKAWFYRLMAWQQRLGLERPLPTDLRIMIGSQWWCLRRATLEKALAFAKTRPDIVRFFRTTWIPDETFFQTIVRHLVPDSEIENRSLTFLLFTDYGMPATFYNDHYDLLLAQDCLFARKISPEAEDLKARLGTLYASAQTTFDVSNEGRALFAFLTQRGRVGRRFAPRFWEADASLTRGKELLLVSCKKWHVAERLVERIQDAGILPAHAYVFDDSNCALPDLGGIGATLTKRHRHRRALVHLLFDSHDSARLLLCLDPARLEMMRDFAGAAAQVRVLELVCRWDDTDIAAHAYRIGLTGPRGADAALVDTLRTALQDESDALQDAEDLTTARLSETASARDNVVSLARFLSIPETQSAALLAGGDLFADPKRDPDP